MTLILSSIFFILIALLINIIFRKVALTKIIDKPIYLKTFNWTETFLAIGFSPTIFYPFLYILTKNENQIFFTQIILFIIAIIFELKYFLKFYLFYEDRLNIIYFNIKRMKMEISRILYKEIENALIQLDGRHPSELRIQYKDKDIQRRIRILDTDRVSNHQVIKLLKQKGVKGQPDKFVF